MHTFPRVKIKGGGKLLVSEGGEGGTRQNRRGPPNFEFLLHFYVTISKILSIL